jgi:hypothetical protein
MDLIAIWEADNEGIASPKGYDGTGLRRSSGDSEGI